MTEPTAVEQTINTILQKSIDVATATGDFLKDQIPDVVKQLITFNLVSEAFWTFFPLTVLIVAFCFIPRELRWAKKYSDESDCLSYTPVIVLNAIIVFIGTLSFLSHITPLIELIFAPKVWLLEYAAHLVHHS